MSESITSTMDTSVIAGVAVETGEETEQLDAAVAGQQQSTTGRVGGAVRELKAILALSKESNFEVNLSKKRKSDHRRYSNEPKSSSSKRDHRPNRFPVTAESELEMSKKDLKPVRFPVTAESELELEIPQYLEAKSSEESPTKPLKKKKSLVGLMESPNVSGLSEEKKRERKQTAGSLLGDITIFKPNKDMFCWRCHKEGVNIACETCPRSYHQKCLRQAIEDEEHWPCPECVGILRAESTQSRSPAMKGMSLEHLCSLLKFAVQRMKQVAGSQPFAQAVDTKDVPEYEKYIVQPMDLSTLEKNIKENLYGSTHAFEADAKWILHNSIVYNSYQSKLTSAARTIMKICKQEMAEIENCPTCYLNANTKKKTWFVEVCPKPHLLVWAKLKGFPFWPGKVMKCRDGNVDVRFFGAHDRAWVPEKECFLYIPRDPNNFRSKRADLEKCIAELHVHVKNLKQVFGQFYYPDARIPINPNDELKQLQIFLPQYKSYINRTKRHKLFHTTDHIGGCVKDKEETTSKEECSPQDVEETNGDEVKTEVKPIEYEEAISKDDSEQMEGYGTDDESMPLIDLKTRKKLLNKSISDESIVNAESDEKDFDPKGPLKGFIRDPIILEMNTDLLRKQFLEKNVDSSMFSDSKSDSSRHSEKISTVDVLEDMEINLGNDQGMPCVNISRKNSFDSSDPSKSDTESNTSSRKGPVKMDVENFEVILTSPTKLKIVDKLMKRLSDGNSSDDGQERGSPKHKVLKRLSDLEPSCVEEDRGETSPEPKQLEEPPMDYSDDEAETNESTKTSEEGISKSDSLGASSCVDSDNKTEKLLEEPLSESNVDIDKARETFEKTKENKSENVAKSDTFIITTNKSEDGTVDRLKIKIKIPKNKPEIVEDNKVEEDTKKDTTQKKFPLRKCLLSEGSGKVNEKKLCLVTDVRSDQNNTQFENAKSPLVEHTDDKQILDKVDITKNIEELPSMENKKIDLKEPTKDITVLKDDKLCKNSANADDKNERNNETEGKTEKELTNPNLEQITPKKSMKETLKLPIEETVQVEIPDKKDLPLKSSKSDAEYSEKAIETGTMIILENGEKAIVSESPTCSETDQIEDESEDNIPLAHIADKSDGKTTQVEPNAMPNEDCEKNAKQKDSDPISTPNESSPTKMSESSELELSSAEKNDKNQKISNQKPKVATNKNLTDVLQEVSKSKNIEIVSEAESTISTVSEISLASPIAQSPDNVSKLLTNEVIRKASSEESSSDESDLPSLKEIQQKISASKKRKRKLSREETKDNEKKAKAEENKEIADKDYEKMDVDKEKTADKKQTSPEKDSGQKEGEKESIFPKISLKNLIVPDTSAKQSCAKTTAEQPVRTQSTQSVSAPVLDANEIKSEVESDQEGETFLENQGSYPNRNQNGVLEKEAKRKYLSALNILDRDSEALHKKKDTGEIRTRSKTEKKKQDALMEENISKTIDDVAVNFGTKRLASGSNHPVLKVHRRSEDAQHPVKTVVGAAPNQNRSENGEIFVKSFAKLVPTLKPRARKSFPQTLSTSTEAKQIQQIKLARREDATSLKSVRRDKGPLDGKSSTPSSGTTTIGIPKILNKDIATSNNGNGITEINTNTAMTTLQQLENMTTNKGYVIVTPQNQDLVMLPPNKPILYQTPTPPRISAAPITTTTQAPPSILPFASSPSLWKPSDKAPVNLTDSQNYIPFNKDPLKSQDTSTTNKKSPFSKQLSLLVSNTISMATQTGQSNVTAALTPAANVTSLTPSQPQQQTAAAGSSTQDEEMPLQNESVSSNGPRDFLIDSVTGNMGTDGQEDLNGGTPNEMSNNEQSNPEEEEFRLIDSLIPGSVAKVVHEIVKRPPPRLKPRPPGMLSTVFREGVPSSAGPVTSKINSVAHKLSDYLRGMLVETLEDLGKSGSHEATIAGLKVEIEALKHKHSIELSEIEKNMCTVLKDIQRSIVEDRERVIDDTRRECEAETIKRIEEAKSKQWCALCQKEAQFYCCWNTSYCDYPCQQKHWPQHMTKCTQNTSNGGINPAQSSTVTTVPTVVRPLVGQQLILRPTGAKPGTIGKIFTKPIQKVYLNRNPKTLRVQSSTGGYLTVMESQPGQYQVVNTIPRYTEVRTYNSNTLTTNAKKPATVTTSSTATKPTVGQKGATPAKVMPTVMPSAQMFEDDSD